MVNDGEKNRARGCGRLLMLAGVLVLITVVGVNLDPGREDRPEGPVEETFSAEDKAVAKEFIDEMMRTGGLREVRPYGRRSVAMIVDERFFGLEFDVKKAAARLVYVLYGGTKEGVDMVWIRDVYDDSVIATYTPGWGFEMK